MTTTRWDFWIDRGGTFTDIIARTPEGVLRTHKLLSQGLYDDAATRGIRDLLGLDGDAPIAAGLVGTVIGFLLLDQRDDQTLSALLVTPLTLNDYVAYRLSLPMLVCLPLTLIMFPLAGLTDLTVVQVVAVALCAAPLAPMYALFIGSFAANKVQGFALAKGIGVLFIPSVVAWFVSPPWQWLLGLNPLYWPLKVFWAFDAGDAWAWAYVVAGLAYQSDR